MTGFNPGDVVVVTKLHSYSNAAAPGYKGVVKCKGPEWLTNELKQRYPNLQGDVYEINFRVFNDDFPYHGYYVMEDFLVRDKPKGDDWI